MSVPYTTGIFPLDPMGFTAPSITYKVASGTTSSIIPGSVIVKTLGTTGNVVAAAADASLVPFCGIAQSLSTETATAVGFVDAQRLLPGTLYVCAPKVTIASQVAYDALVGSRVLIDVTAGVTTIDTAAADNAANNIIIEPLTEAVFNGNRVAFTVAASKLYSN